MSHFVSIHQVRFQFRLQTEYIPTADNVLADALSRAGSHKYREIVRAHCEQLGGTPTERVVSPDMFNFTF